MTTLGSAALAIALIGPLPPLGGGPAAAFSVPGNSHRPIPDGDFLDGRNVDKPLALESDGEFADVIIIPGVRFKKGEAARLLALGTLSLESTKGSGDAVLQLRVTIDGVPEGPVYSSSITDGTSLSSPVNILCTSFPADDEDHAVALQAAVVGTGALTVNAGNFDLVGWWNPGGL
jgi:hypothetical protein